MQTTLKGLRNADACTERYTFLRKALGKNYGDSTPITMTQILDHNGLDDCLWAIFHTQNGSADKMLRLFACDCAEHVLPIFEKQRPSDSRPRECIAVARRYANGEATAQERDAAGAAAWAAAWAAARDAARADAWAAAGAAARAAARAAAGDAAGDAEQQWQAARLRELLAAEGGECPKVISLRVAGRAILEGRKTQMRRVIDFTKARGRGGISRGCFGADGYDTVTEKDIVRVPWTAGHISALLRCPYGEPGDRLWVKETWQINSPPSGFIYAADDTWLPGGTKWRHCMFMPRKVSRITLEITEIRVQRVQEITREDAEAEGLMCSKCEHLSHLPQAAAAAEYRRSVGYMADCYCVDVYEAVWDSINAKRGFPWASNPWAWAISFKQVQP